MTATPFSTRPTLCRWGVVAVATLMSMTMYLDRTCVYFAQTFIQEDLGLTPSQASWIVSAFFWAYALAQIPAGWLSDRWGGRLMLSIYILSWSTFILLMGFSTSLYFLLAMQLGHGLGQAGGYPTSAGLLSRWMPLSSRGTASSIVAFGGRAGGFVAPILTAWLIVLFVPVEKSSLITAQQLTVSEIGPFSQSLSPVAGQQAESAARTELLKSIRSGLPQDAGALISQIAEWQEAVDRDKKLLTESKLAAAEKKIELTAAELEVLVRGLNGLLTQPQLASQESVAGSNLARQAKALMQRRDSGETLSSLETARMNRLVLEALFPKMIGKVYVQGWRRVLMTYGAAGLFVAFVFWLVTRNQPQDHPWCNAAEVELIQAGRSTSQASTAKTKLNWGQVLRSRSLWLSSISQFGTNIGWLFVTATLPEYLDQVHHVEVIQRGYLSSLPMGAGVFGMLLGGRLTDYMRYRWGVRWGRALPMGLTRFGAALAYVGCLFANDPWTATILCMAVAFFQDLGVAATWAFVQDAGGRYVGVVLGFGNMWGNIGAAVAPQVYSSTRFLTHNNWNAVFAVCAISLTIAGIAALMIDASQPIVEEDAAPEGVQ